MFYIKHWLIIGHGRQELQELRDVVTSLTQRLENLTNNSFNNEKPLNNTRNLSRIADNRSNIVDPSSNRTERSLSPVLIRDQERELMPMSHSYKKTLHVTYIFY